MEDGGWRMGDGGWGMEDRGWRIEHGKWRMGGWRMKVSLLTWPDPCLPVLRQLALPGLLPGLVHVAHTIQVQLLRLKVTDLEPVDLRHLGHLQ